MEHLTVTDIAKELRVHPETVRKWIRSGELPATNIGPEHRPVYRVTRQDFEAFLQRRRTDRGNQL